MQNSLEPIPTNSQVAVAAKQREHQPNDVYHLRPLAVLVPSDHYQLQLMLSLQGIEDNLVVINNILSALTPAVIFGFAANLLQEPQVNGGTFSTGTFLAFNAAFVTFISGATSLSSTVVDILEVLPLWERAQPILHATPEVDAFRTDPGRLF